MTPPRHLLPTKYLTNTGTISGVWIFHRHGDRAPNRYLGSPHHYEQESEHWYSRIPPRSASSGTGGNAFASLSQFYAPKIHDSQNGGLFLDTGREPFGFLSYLGMDQMRDVGGRFRRRYERFGHRVSGGKEDEGGEQYKFLQHWDVHAYSTNYLRTVMSVQCFLDGLIGTNKQTDDNSGRRAEKQIYAGGGLSRYYKDAGIQEQLAHLNKPTLTTVEDVQAGGCDGVKVEVRDKALDTLNAFDRRPKMMNDLVKNVIATEQFQR